MLRLPVPVMSKGRFDSDFKSSFTHALGESMCHEGSKLALKVRVGV